MQQRIPSPRLASDEDLFRRNVVRTPVALVPEIALDLAAEPFAIFEAAEAVGAERPYWAFAWCGGQALARWLLDHPAAISGQRVLDIGSGSGLAAIAALQAGAKSAIANDTDPVACIAANANAAANGVCLEVSQDDLLGDDPDVDLILIGDLFYEPELVTRVTSFLERASRRGTNVLFADRTTSRRPALQFEQVAQYVAPLTPAMEIAYIETGRIWRLV